MVALCIVAPAPLRAVSAATLTLTEAVGRALAAGATARLARLERERAAAAAAAAASIYWPRAGVSSQAGYTNRLDERIEAIDADGNVREYGLGSLASNEGWFNFVVSQVVFDLARWKQAESAQLEAEVAALREAHEHESASFAVLEAYVEALRATNLLERQRERLARIEAFDARAAALLEAGRCLAGERSEVGLYLAEARLELRAREARAASARSALALLLGAEAPDWDAVDADLSRLGPGDFALPLDRIDAAPELRLLAVRREIERLNIDAARAGRYPVVALGGGYTNYGAYRYDNFVDELRVGIDFQMPLFEGFRSSHEIAGAQKALAAADVRFESLRSAKRVRIEALAAGLDAAERAATLLQERERLGAERVRLATVALDSQRGSVPVALAAQRESDASGDAGVAARLQPVLLRGEILREAGQLTRVLREPAGDA